MGALGRWIDKIHPATEDVILMRRLIPFSVDDGRGAGCIIGHAELAGQRLTDAIDAPYQKWNALCMRFAGVYSVAQRRDMADSRRYPMPHATADYNAGAQAAVLLRNRILKNRAKRALANVPQASKEAELCPCSQ